MAALLALPACDAPSGLRTEGARSTVPSTLPVPLTTAPAPPPDAPAAATPSATPSRAVATATAPLPPPARPAGRDPHQRYRVTVDVLESPEHGPELCVGGVQTSLPPQCGGIPVTPFSWRDVPGRESRNGTTWGTATFVGTFDGRTFRLTEKPRPPRRPGPVEDAFETPCKAPAGGWRTTDERRVSDDDFEAVVGYANGEPDVAGVWLSWLRPPPGEGTAYTEAVLNLAFTGDLERHRRAASALWGGPLCVTGLPRARAELARAQDRLQAMRDEAARAGVHVWGSSVDEIGNRVVARVLVADGVTRRWLDAEFGPGVVVGEGIFEPVG
ncbi:MAG TPA: hypothetical protein VNA20_05235 [Frankiaceae bacterium]|nr:hypothetical protein [Frankiaceae bacterium]